MKRFTWIASAAVVSLAGVALAASLTIDRWRRLPNVTDSTGAVTLPNGWRITPAGKHVKLPGDLPMKMQVVAGGAQLLVVTGGYHGHSLSVVDVHSAEVSEDGHQWSDAAYATDFTQKAWTNSYSSRSEPDADDRLISSPAGYLWDACARKGLTFRSYGEMSSFVSTPDSEPQAKGTGSLTGHVSVEWLKLKAKSARDPEKAAVFVKELQDAEEAALRPGETMPAPVRSVLVGRAVAAK